MLVYLALVDQNEFQLPDSFTNHADLIAEADFYCLREMKDWLKMECKKNSARINFATQHGSYSYLMNISGNTAVLYDFYMNEEERQAFLSNRITVAQINRLKLVLQQDRFRCDPTNYVNENGNEMRLITIETFSRR